MQLFSLAICDNGRLDTMVFKEYDQLLNWIKLNIEEFKERDTFLDDLQISGYGEYNDPGDDDMDGDLKMVANKHFIP